jgi:alanine racemase
MNHLRPASAAHAMPDIAAGETAMLSVDLEAISDNYALLAGFAGGAECAAVVKADAYGTGMAAVAPTLYRRGCRTFFVATLAEAIALRRRIADAAIYVLNSCFAGGEAQFMQHGLRPVIGSLAALGSWRDACRTTANPPAAALHLDTGMNRLGIGPDEIGQLIDDQARHLAGVRLDLIMSHLACADEPHHERNRRQLRLFRSALAQLPPARASLANSAGILLGPDYHFDLVRPGIGLYGGRPAAGGPNPMRPVIRLVSHILQVRSVEAGDSVGYGASFTAHRPTRIATIPVGYADGYFRALAASGAKPGARVVIAGQAMALAGRVSMDLITVDVTGLPAETCEPGTPVEIIGDAVTVDDLADVAGTISYEILTALGHRYRRIYAGS